MGQVRAALGRELAQVAEEEVQDHLERKWQNGIFGTSFDEDQNPVWAS
jgi:hypothetical protein